MNSIAYVNANVIPMENGARHSAILIHNGIIAALGGDDEIVAAAKRVAVTPIDAKGATILPGLFDDHVHVMITGQNAAGIDLFDAGSIPKVIERLKGREKTLPEGQWVFGKQLDESRLKEGRPPTMDELDVIGHPVFLSDRGGHYTVVNTAGYRLLGIADGTPGVRKDADGRPNGRLQDEANAQSRARFLSTWSEDQRKDVVRYTANLAVSKGITTINAIEGLGSDEADQDINRLLSMAKELPLDVKIFWSTTDVDKIVKKGLDTWGGDILLDGSIGSRTAAFSEKYEDGDTCGYLNYSDEQVEAWVEQALIRDLCLSFHCIGELAIRQALDAMEKVLNKYPEKRHTHRLRLDHFGFPTQRDIHRCGALGVRVSTQPAFTFLRGGPETVYRSRLGERRERGGYPSRRLLDAGVILGGGSDSDITPMDALLGIHAAVNQPYPENAITPYEAVRMFTIDAAKVCFLDDQKGSLKVGKQGDLAVLSDDPMTCDPRKIRDIKVLTTVYKGRIVYEG
ncbi:MAG: amidohydrolase [Christensenellales bacterium]|jgi:predicted amidohydrolase YtcJ